MLEWSEMRHSKDTNLAVYHLRGAFSRWSANAAPISRDALL